MSFVGTAVIGAGVLGAGATIYSANTAAKAQENAANASLVNSENQFNATNNNLAPFRQIGVDAGNELTSRLADLTSPILLNESTLENTPGYQFNLTQGLKATQNSAAARGLGTSGAALKGASTFATGLADNTYKTQFDIANTNQTNAYNRLKGLVDTGETAAAGTGALAQAATTTQNTALTQGGTAAAAGANATGGAISNLSNNVSGYALSKGNLFSTSPTINANGSIAGAVGPTSVGGAPLVY